ncbi:hypothetical protein BaRGS_00029234 [Batillaria attramentaria]|uniref:Uncharacterized protein n=1 Tax=Batillaria attramentaria TaxID=370345 RepID=A0ABD0JX04_9CAEN
MMADERSWKVYATGAGLLLVIVSAIFIFVGTVSPNWMTVSPNTVTEIYHGLFESCQTQIGLPTTCEQFVWGNQLSGTGPYKIRVVQGFAVLSSLVALGVIITVIVAALYCCHRFEFWEMFEIDNLTLALDVAIGIMVLFASISSITFLSIHEELELYPQSTVSWCPGLLMAGWCIAAVARAGTRFFCSNFTDD